MWKRVDPSLLDLEELDSPTNKEFHILYVESLPCSSSMEVTCSLLLLLLLSSSSSILQAEARLLPSSEQERYVKVLESLGVLCSCCDEGRGQCSRSWSFTCSKLHCRPFKYL
ncbi:hypothetical protein KFK09_021628 [Dendrobium nobile]|uniref:Uncharacterized protein n=1 Tax=Dendrobium nobile TaxID=94219 RepID=A0A8T3AQG7_DENNO|nr:hypothetical protein KFK09_021628 [Dendrobium nobile]